MIDLLTSAPKPSAVSRLSGTSACPSEITLGAPSASDQPTVGEGMAFGSQAGLHPIRIQSHAVIWSGIMLPTHPMMS